MTGKHGRVFDLAPDCQVKLFEAMTPLEAERWMSELTDEVVLEAKTIFLFGKTVLQPRLVGWAGDLPYTYSKQTLSPRPFGTRLRALLERTREISGHEFNHALVNLYRDGSDSMGMHSDDEAELGNDPVVGSWSFGATRTFVLASKRGKQRFRFVLSSGTLLTMEGATQHRFRHGLPKAKNVLEPRLNVTFRKILR